jgi:ubiquinone/menaquinone biosynthesis C-methylase UbiE
MNQSDPKSRFSSRVENYVKYRPTYPPQLLDLFRREFNFTRNWTVADIGSGTGISSKLLLDHGNTVFAIEPNHEMREAAESLLAHYPNFHSIDASAEATTMPDKSMDLIVAAQAFHWFNPKTTPPELARILKQGGVTVLIWNTRLTDTTPFQGAYEDLLLNYATDYNTVRHEHVTDELMASFFGTPDFHRATLPNAQQFDFEGVKGRLLSSSYSPLPDDPRHAPMLTKLREIFDQHQQDGRVTFAYKTEVFWSRLHAR